MWKTFWGHTISYTVNLARSGWDSHMICGYFAGSFSLNKGRLRLIRNYAWLHCDLQKMLTCYMMQTDWKGNPQKPQQASVLDQCRMIHHICAKFPQPCPNRSLTFNRPGNSLSSLHTSHFGDQVPAAAYVFDIVCTYHCTELKWKCLPPCLLEWVYYPMTSFTGWSVFTQRTPADCMNFWWLHHPL